MQHPHGLTLIEMTVVLSLLALAVSLVAANYREPVDRVRLENTFETVERLDQRVRRWCKTNDAPACITVDLDRGVLTAENGNGRPLPLPEVTIPDGMKLKELRIMGESRFGRDTKIPYNTCGTAPGWAYSIVDSRNREKYRLIVGATGQSIPFDDEDAMIRFERFYEHQ